MAQFDFYFFKRNTREWRRVGKALSRAAERREYTSPHEAAEAFYTDRNGRLWNRNSRTYLKLVNRETEAEHYWYMPSRNVPMEQGKRPDNEPT